MLLAIATLELGGDVLRLRDRTVKRHTTMSV